MSTHQRRLGQFTVSAIGLGAMPFSFYDGEGPSRERVHATVAAALDAGITLIDTADIYAPSWDTMGHNERAVADALAAYQGDRSGVVVATKAGITRGEGETWGRDSSLGYLRGRVEASLRDRGVQVAEVRHGAAATLVLAVPPADRAAVASAIAELTAGQGRPTPAGTRWLRG